MHAVAIVLILRGKELLYLASVLCFIFVDEVHQKESKTHTETFTRK